MKTQESDEKDTANKNSHFITARFALQGDDIVSEIMLMTISFIDCVVLSLSHLLPLAVLVLLFFWRIIKMEADEEQHETKYWSWYKPQNEDHVALEYTIIFIVLVMRLLPRCVTFLQALCDFINFCGMWAASRSYGGRMLINGIVVIGLSKFLTPLLAIGMGIYLVLFTAQKDRNLLMIIFQLVFFEFVNTLDTAIVNAYISYKYERRCMCIKVLNFKYAIDGEESFWRWSESTLEDVRKALEKTNGSTDSNECISTLMSRRKGLGISRIGGSTCTIKLSVEKFGGMAKKKQRAFSA